MEVRGIGGMRHSLTSVAAICVAATVGACMGRAPQPVAVIQPQDQMMDCTAIYAEIQANNGKVQQLARTTVGKWPKMSLPELVDL
jgi:hypothetical protein